MIKKVYLKFFQNDVYKNEKKPFLYIRKNIANQKYNESSFRIESDGPSLYFFVLLYLRNTVKIIL